MKKEFYIGQPLIIKETGEKVTFTYSDGLRSYPCNVSKKVRGVYRHVYYDYEDLEPSTEFKFSEIIAGLEQGYFDVGTEFQSECQNFVVGKTQVGLGLRGKEDFYLEANIHAGSINGHWTLVEPRKEMTLEEIEAELGYKVKLKKYV